MPTLTIQLKRAFPSSWISFCLSFPLALLYSTASWACHFLPVTLYFPLCTKVSTWLFFRGYSIRRLAAILKKVLDAMLRSEIIPNCLMLLPFSCLGIHTPSISPQLCHLHLPPEHPEDPSKLLQKPKALFEDLVQYITWAFG